MVNQFDKTLTVENPQYVLKRILSMGWCLLS